MRTAIALPALVSALLLMGCERENLLKESKSAVGSLSFAVSESLPELRTKGSAAEPSSLDTIVLTTSDGETLRLVMTEEPLPCRSVPATKAKKVYKSDPSAAIPHGLEYIAAWAYRLTGSQQAPKDGVLDTRTSSPLKARFKSGTKYWYPVDNNDKFYDIPFQTVSGYRVLWYGLAPYEALSAASALVVADGTNPTLTWTVNATVKDQLDVMAAVSAQREENASKSDSIGLTFRHLLTGVRFKRDKDLDIRNITVSGVYDQGVADLTKADRDMSEYYDVDEGVSAWHDASKDLWSVRTKLGRTYSMDMEERNWSNGHPDDASKEQQYDYAAQDPNILMMIPQLTPGGAKITVNVGGESFEGEISGHRWLPGRLVTYRITGLDGSEANYELTIDPTSLELETGGPSAEVTATVKVNGFPLLSDDVTWTLVDDDAPVRIAPDPARGKTVTVSPVKKGATTLKASWTTPAGVVLTKECAITVKPKVLELILNYHAITLAYNMSETITAKVLENGVDITSSVRTTIVWTGSNPTPFTASVSAEKYTIMAAAKDGSTLIKASITRNIGGKDYFASDSCTVTILRDWDPGFVTSINYAEFKINGSGTSLLQNVYFTPGNLRYTGTKQWDICQNEYEKGSYFGWGTSGLYPEYQDHQEYGTWIKYDGGIRDGKNLSPRATSTTEYVYQSTYAYNSCNRYAYGPSIYSGQQGSFPRSSGYYGYMSPHLTGKGRWHDWGYYWGDQIVDKNPGRIPAAAKGRGNLRTLSGREWWWLVQGRTNKEKLMGLATVAGQKGLILLPPFWNDKGLDKKLPGLFKAAGEDMGGDWSGLTFVPVGSTNNPHSNISQKDKRWTANVYTAEQWKVMSRLGAVFLPAAGLRNGTSITNERPGIKYYNTTTGVYWSSTGYDGGTAYCVAFDESDIGGSSGGSYTAGLSGKYLGLQVRLVYGDDSCKNALKKQEDATGSGYIIGSPW